MLLDASLNGASIAPSGNRDRYGNYAPANAYRCLGKDRWVAIAVRTAEEWRALCRAMGLAQFEGHDGLQTLEGRRAAADEIDAAIGAWTATRDRYDVMEALQAAGVPAGAVQHSDDKGDRDPQLASRGFYWRVDDEIVGSKRYEGVPLATDEFATSITTPAPWMGEHTREVLRTVLGYSDAQVDELSAAGVTWESDVKRGVPVA
jgi:crotonobetainyl-CoA:carnitine CoA-transferase CaiB-like acyl-CoA transferase